MTELSPNNNRVMIDKINFCVDAVSGVNSESYSWQSHIPVTDEGYIGLDFAATLIRKRTHTAEITLDRSDRGVININVDNVQNVLTGTQILPGLEQEIPLSDDRSRVLLQKLVKPNVVEGFATSALHKSGLVELWGSRGSKLIELPNITGEIGVAQLFLCACHRALENHKLKNDTGAI